MVLTLSASIFLHRKDWVTVDDDDDDGDEFMHGALGGSSREAPF